MPSGGFGAASFPSVEKTIAKLSQQRQPEREGGRKTGRKQVKKGFNQKFVGFSPFFCTFGVGVLCGGLSAASFPPVVQTIAKVSQQRRQKREGGQKQAENMWKRACTNHKVVEHRGRISKNGLVIISEMLSSTCKTGRRRGSGRTVEVQELGSFGLPSLRRKL